MDGIWTNTINDIIYLANYVDSSGPVNYDDILTTLVTLRGNLETSTRHVEYTVWAKFDEAERLIRSMSNISGFQPCIAIPRDEVHRKISLGISRSEIAKHFGVSLKTLHRRIRQWGLR